MNAPNPYQQQSIETASPARLVSMLYHGALGAAQRARTALLADGSADVHRDLIKAQDIVHELRVTLDHDAGGDIAANLEALYDWCYEQLVLANTSKSAAPLDTVCSVLSQLAASWDEMVEQQLALVDSMPSA